MPPTATVEDGYDMSYGSEYFRFHLAVGFTDDVLIADSGGFRIVCNLFGESAGCLSATKSDTRWVQV